MTDLRKTPLRRLLLMSALMGGASLVEDTATGNPVTFETDVAKPLRSLLIPFTPVQSGTGDPSPQNVRPLDPWNGLNVKHGQNVYDYHDNGSGFIDKSGTIEYNPLWQHTALIPVNGHTAIFYYGITTPGSSPYSAWYKEDGTFLSSFKQTTGQNTVSVPENAYFVSFSVLEQPPSIDDVHSFQLFYVDSLETHSIVFPSPVYGGTLDAVSGVLTVEYAIVALNTVKFYAVREGFFASYAFLPAYADRSKLMCNIYKAVSLTYWDEMQDGQIMGIPESGRIRIKDESCADVTALETQLTEKGAVLAYTLPEPQTVQLTPSQITALVGNNTIWSDADGQLTAVYLKKA